MEIIKESARYRVFKCEHCDAIHTVYRFSFSTTLVRILSKAWMHCVKNNTRIISRKTLGLTGGEYSNFSKLYWFGLMYKEGDDWKMPMKRVKDFLSGNWEVAKYCERNSITGEHHNSEERVKIDDIIKVKNKANYRDFYRQFVEYVSVEE